MLPGAQPILHSKVLHHFLSLSVNGRIWTVEIKIMSLVFYHCATGAQPILHTKVLHHFLSLSVNGRIWTVEIKIMIMRLWVFYHCASEAQPILLTILCAIFSLSLSNSGRFPMVNIRIMSLVFYHPLFYWGATNFSLHFMHHFLSLDVNGRIWTLDIWIMSLVFYHCATGAQPILHTVVQYFPSLDDANGRISILDIWIMS